MIGSDDLRLGVSLSGGGAKGAYQIGVMETLYREWDDAHIAALSGASIGALNAMLLDGAPYEEWWARWSDLSAGTLLAPDHAPEAQQSRFWHEIEQEPLDAEALQRKMKEYGVRQFTTDGLAAFLRRNVDPARLQNTARKRYACAYNVRTFAPEYFELSSLPFDEAVRVTEASCALPGLYSPVRLHTGDDYCDGGMAPPSAPSRNHDKIPIRPLAACGCNVVLVLYLTHHDRVDARCLPTGTELIELYPSHLLEAVPGLGTLDFRPQTVAAHYALGVSDCREFLLPVVRGLSGDGGYAAAADALRARNRSICKPE